MHPVPNPKLTTLRNLKFKYLIRTGAGDIIILSAAWAKRARVEYSGQHWLFSQHVYVIYKHIAPWSLFV